MASTDPSASSPIEPEAARATAGDILSRPEFQPRPPSLLSRLVGWLGDLFGGSPPSPGGGGGGLVGDSAVVRTVVWILLAGLLVGVVVTLVRCVRGAPVPFRRRRAKVTESDEILPLDEDDAAAGPPRYLTGFEPGEVEALEAAGQWRDALLARYRGAVAHLIGAGVVGGQPGASSAQLLAEVDARHSELSRHFARLTATFETVWYGGAEADEALAAAARREALAVDAAVGSTVRRAPPAAGKGITGTGTGTTGTTGTHTCADTDTAVILQGEPS